MTSYSLSRLIHQINHLCLALLFWVSQTGFVLHPSWDIWGMPSLVPNESHDQPVFIQLPGTPAGSPSYYLGSGDFQLWLSEESLWLSYATDSIQAVNLKINFPGSNPELRIDAIGQLSTSLSVIKGLDPASWNHHLGSYEAIRYKDLYPGLDLVIQGRNHVGNIAPFSWHLEPHGLLNWRPPLLQIEGAESVLRNPWGYRVRTPLGDLNLPSIERKLGQIPFMGEAYSHIRFHSPLRQVANGLTYSTFLGGGQSDTAYDIAVSQDGSVFIAGSTSSLDFPTTSGVFDRRAAETDAFVARFNPGGLGLAYMTLLGGRSLDRAFSLALDGESVLLVGETLSADFPTTANSFDPTCGSDGNCDAGEAGLKSDAFFARLNQDGSVLTYATYLGGMDEDSAYGIAHEPPSTYITGITYSKDFPSSETVDAADAFVVRFDQLNTLGYATLIGGSAVEAAFAIQAQDGEAYIAGETFSPNFPAAGYRGNREAFLSRLDPNGSLISSALIGGVGDDRGLDLALDIDGNAYLAGWTGSSDFPATFSKFAGGTSDGFIARYSSELQLQFAAFIGGDGLDEVRSVATAQENLLYLVGLTDSPGFTTTANSAQTQSTGGEDGFAIALDLTDLGSPQLIYSSLLGGSQEDRLLAMARSGENRLYLAGFTRSSDFPTSPDAVDTNLQDSQDAFFSVLVIEAAPVPLPTSLPIPPSATPSNTFAAPPALPADTSPPAVLTAVRSGDTTTTPPPTSSALITPGLPTGEIVQTPATPIVLSSEAPAPAVSETGTPAGLIRQTALAPAATETGSYTRTAIVQESVETSLQASTQTSPPPAEIQPAPSTRQSGTLVAVGGLVLAILAILAAAAIVRRRSRN